LSYLNEQFGIFQQPQSCVSVRVMTEWNDHLQALETVA